MTDKIQAPDPGIYEGIPFEEYVSWDAVNNSSLTLARRSMAHYLYGDHREPTKAMQLGTLGHSGALEPLTIAQRFVVLPPFEQQIRRPNGEPYSNPKATNAYREKVDEFYRVNDDKEIVDQATYDKMLGIVEALHSDARARSYLCGLEPTEVSIVWDDPRTGLRCKGRVDKLLADEQLLADLKTTRDASRFERAIADFAYHRQAAFYIDGMEALTGIPYRFAIVAVESEAPHGVRAAPVDDESVQAGRDEYRELLEQIARARKSGTWPGYEHPECWRLPEWAFAQASESLELNIGGQRVAI